LPEGHVLEPGDLVARSPAEGGLPPYELDGLLGRSLIRPLAVDETVLLGDLTPATAPVAAREA
jgi:N-acetylneuraminate synthase/sialic acid synthase